MSLILTCTLCLIAGLLITLIKSRFKGCIVSFEPELFIFKTGDVIDSVPSALPFLSYFLNSLEYEPESEKDVNDKDALSMIVQVDSC